MVSGIILDITLPRSRSYPMKSHAALVRRYDACTRIQSVLKPDQQCHIWIIKTLICSAYLHCNVM